MKEICQNLRNSVSREFSAATVKDKNSTSKLEKYTLISDRKMYFDYLHLLRNSFKM